MRMIFRFVLPLLLVLGGITWAASPLVENLIDHWLQNDVEMRAQILFDSLKDDITADAPPDLSDLFTRVHSDTHLLALGLCGPDGALRQRTRLWPSSLGCPPPSSDTGHSFSFLRLPRGPTLVSSFSLPSHQAKAGFLVTVHDIGFIDERRDRAEAYLVGILAVLTLAAAFVAILIARLTWRGWVKDVRRELSAPGETTAPSRIAHVPEIASLVDDMQKILRTGDEARTAETIRIEWTAESLKHLLKTELADAEVIVLSNREPYIHNRDETGLVRVQRPASGLVTAIEPITRACGGIWIAHGSGAADMEAVDDQDHVPVPPEAPSYLLRRLWLSDAEVDGYYYGFANEGLWPLCHIAFVRPVFRSADWQQYVAVNRKFADAAIAEAKTGNPLVLVQDYHFALVPQMIRESLPDATIITFWHIPWPNPEVFSICPWRKEILQGLLSSSILGFHTRFHCLNFLDSVDRFLESHIDRERSAASTGERTALIKPYPISIEWPPRALAGQPSVSDCRRIIRKQLGFPEDTMLAVGVERLDYTKGIADRFRAVESLLEDHPEWIGRFRFLQIAAPSRSQLAAYRTTQIDVERTAQAINQRFATPDWQPIVLIQQHHEPEQVFTLFRAADVCVVSSLHDGMNLVAKEFVSARDDEDGVLVLSTFAGASRELLEALIVNPYDNRAMGEAIHQGLVMPLEQRHERMRLMREMVSENNIYFWAGRMLMDAARIRKRQSIESQTTRISNE